MKKAQPFKGVLSGFSEWLQKALAGTYDPSISVSPYGNYSGNVSGNANTGGLLTNPWGVSARVSFGQFGDRGSYSDTLAPGQSIDLSSGRLSDPKLNAQTAQRLNDQTQQRQIQEAGLNQAAATSARQTQSVLATLDQMYLANAQSTLKTSEEKSGFSLAKEIGFNQSRTKTILGEQPKPVVKPPRSL
jgi:hypothetical protein